MKTQPISPRTVSLGQSLCHLDTLPLQTENVQGSGRGVELAQRATPPVKSRRSRFLARGSVEQRRLAGADPSCTPAACVAVARGRASRRRAKAPGKQSGEAAALLPQAEAEAPRRSGLFCMPPAWCECSNYLLPVAFKPGRRVRPLHLPCHDAPRTMHYAPPPPRAQKRLPTHPLPTIPTKFVNPCRTNTNAPTPIPYIPLLCAPARHALPLVVARGFPSQAGARRVRGFNVMVPRWSSVRFRKSGSSRATAVVISVHHGWRSWSARRGSSHGPSTSTVR
jgi:hypothetical protein